jgi:hypothetical protein
MAAVPAAWSVTTIALIIDTVLSAASAYLWFRYKNCM